MGDSGMDRTCTSAGIMSGIMSVNDAGITGTHAEIVRVHRLTDRIAIIQVRSPYIDERGWRNE